MEQQKQKDTGGEEQCHLCRITYSIFSTFPSMPSAMALNVETGEFFPLDTLRSYSTGHKMAEALGYAWACNCRGRALKPFDQQFVLHDRQGSVLSDAYYTVRFPDGRLAHGTTDAEGRTRRYQTNDARKLSVYTGHRKA